MRAKLASAAILGVLAFALGAGDGSGHPGHGVPTVRVGGFAFAPDALTIVKGDAVVWTWNALDTNHSVTSVAGQPDAFDSDAGKAPGQVNHARGDAYSHLFDSVGTYNYFCKVHPSMRGTVVVQALGGDDSGPRVRSLRAKRPKACRKGSKGCSKPGGLFSFSLSEAATLFVDVERVNRKGEVEKVVRSFTRALEGGSHELKLGVNKFKPGSYVFAVEAQDAAKNSSGRFETRFKVR